MKRKPPGTPRGGEFDANSKKDAEVGLSADDAIPDDVVRCLPPATTAAWLKVANLVPSSAVLAGGTGLAAHIQHRTSEDLDFMLMADEDLRALADRLDRVGMLSIDTLTDDTLNCYLDTVKLQFLRAINQVSLRPPVRIAGLNVASVEDIAAMKLGAIDGRGQIRDYFDLMELDRRGIVRVEEALHYYVQRYETDPNARAAVPRIVMALGFFDDVQEDPGLLVSKAEVEAYWRKRHPAVVRSLGAH